MDLIKSQKFAANRFDYIVFDEFHHSAANSYKTVLQHFDSKFLLGLTATPERMDGRDVLEICDYEVAYESRLFDAIDQGWLTPFATVTWLFLSQLPQLGAVR